MACGPEGNGASGKGPAASPPVPAGFGAPPAGSSDRTASAQGGRGSTQGQGSNANWRDGAAVRGRAAAQDAGTASGSHGGGMLWTGARPHQCGCRYSTGRTGACTTHFPPVFQNTGT